MKVTIDVNKIVLVKGKYGPDYIYLHTDLPTAQYPFDQKESIRITAASNFGEKYIIDNFPFIPVEIVEAEGESL
jgi:hypothetical protein